MKIKLKITYDGTNYCGWQIQQNLPTIQGEIEKALTKTLLQPITILGASRTDSGVHAMAQFAVFSIEELIIPIEKLTMLLNKKLPEDIVVVDCQIAPHDFHPIASTTNKTYEYKILNTKYPIPTKRNTCFHVGKKLDIQKMQEATKYLLGTHEFTAFCSVGGKVKSHIRTVISAEIVQNGDYITLIIKGDGFLYNMVRIIVGTLIYVGHHRIKPEEIANIIISKDRKKAGRTAPPQGLTLMEVNYE